MMEGHAQRAHVVMGLKRNVHLCIPVILLHILTFFNNQTSR